MNLTHILIFTLVAGSVGRFSTARQRPWLLQTASILAVFWMQPSMPVRNLDFWLPTASIALAGLVWASTRQTSKAFDRQDVGSAALTMTIAILIGMTRYIEPLCCITPTRPPAAQQVLLCLALISLFGYGMGRLLAGNRGWMIILVVAILVSFVLLKSDVFAQSTSSVLRSVTGQNPDLATSSDIRWLGFSYVSFRLLHTLLDRLAGRLPDLSLRDYLVYIIFYPAYTAGPIDRVQRFVQDLQQPFILTASQTLEGGKRLLLGVFNKFVLADTLALIAINATNASQVRTAGWMWVLLYAYAFRIYLDFSGYTDIAIGLGLLMGIRLPENFDRPYRKPNLTAFWNAWHITLAQWFRAYYFNPLTRALRTTRRKISMPLIIFFSQVTTMLLIGLWHSITLNFAIWGLWHGIGLFIHNRWSAFIRSRLVSFKISGSTKRLMETAGALITFHYVTLGWVWFALPSVDLSWRVLTQLTRF